MTDALSASSIIGWAVLFVGDITALLALVSSGLFLLLSILGVPVRRIANLLAGGLFATLVSVVGIIVKISNDELSPLTTLLFRFNNFWLIVLTGAAICLLLIAFLSLSTRNN